MLTKGSMAGQKRILIVDDNPDNRILLTLILAREGYDIAEAATGLDALTKAHLISPDLIIMDLSMPGMSGDEATERLKAEPSTKHIPVIINTALDARSSRVHRAIAAGAAEVLYKPTSLKTFRDLMTRYFDPTMQAL